MTPYLEKFEGKRFNSPNDLVYRSDGSLYFTDPPYGLLKQDDDPAKELKFNGVFRYADGKLQAVIKDLTRPNGIAFSPDEKTLYVANSDEKHKSLDALRRGRGWHGHERPRVRRRDGGKGRRAARRHEGRFAGQRLRPAVPGGIWVFSPDGKHLGTIKPPETPANCNWGDDGKTLYITARTGRVPHQACGGGREAALPGLSVTQQEQDMKRRSYLKAMLAALRRTQAASRPKGDRIRSFCTWISSVDPAKETGDAAQLRDHLQAGGRQVSRVTST